MLKKAFLLILSGFLTFGLTGQDLIPVNFTQSPILKAFAGNDTVIIVNQSVTLGGYPTASGGTPSYIYSWLPAEGLDDPTSSNPVATPDKTVTYTLTVSDLSGCQAMQQVNIRVEPSSGIGSQSLSGILTVFPNPSTGVIQIKGQGIHQENEISVQVINRLGQVVFQRNYTAPDFSDGLTVEIGTTEPGVYFLKVYLKDRILSERLIIQ